MPQVDVTKNAVCLMLSLKSVGTSRQVPTSHIEIDADPDRIGVSKSLLKSPQLAAIKSRDGHARHWLYAHSVANGLVKSGVYLVGHKAVPDIEEYMKLWQADRDALVDRLADSYAAVVLNDQRNLKAEFDPKDYPGVRLGPNGIQVSKEALKAEFSIYWEFKEFVTPDSLKNVSAEFYEEAKAKAAATAMSLSTEVVYSLREEAKQFFGHFLDKLTPGPDGKQKILHTSSVEKVKEFCQLFDSKNIGSDLQLALLVERAKSAMNGVTKDALKVQEPLRDSVRTEFEKLNSAIDGLLVDKPTRKFQFEDAA